MVRNMNKYRTDLACEKQDLKNLFCNNYEENNIKVSSIQKKNYFYKTIEFSSLGNIKTILKKELLNSLKIYSINKDSHFFIVGLGNDNHTADSVGPKVLKYIVANSYLENLDIKLNVPKISFLEPGVLGETGIETKRIIESVMLEIKPDIIILIDAYVSSDIKYLNKCIQITNEGITPGSGLHGINKEISENTLGIPILVIGIPTAIEMVIDDKTYFLSTKDIDSYIANISKIIGEAIQDVLYHI